MDPSTLADASIESDFARGTNDISDQTTEGVVRILERSIYRGPNIYSLGQMIRMRIHIGPLEQRPSNTLPEFTERLIEMLPGLVQHHCSLGRPGGLVDRLKEGTWFGHVAEHVALELQRLAGASVTRGKTRSVRGRQGVYDVLFSYQAERAALLAGRHAISLLSTLLPPGLVALRGLSVLAESELPPAAGLEERVAEISAATRATAFGPSTQAIVDAARRRGIPVTRLDDRSLIQLGQGRRQKRIRASVTGMTSHIAVEIAGDKHLTRQLLRQAALPAPQGAVVRTIDEARRERVRLFGPVVVKPLSANHGRGVTLGIVSDEDLVGAFETASSVGNRVVIEEQLPGMDHRFLVIGGKVVAVARRVPAGVVGNGTHNVEALVSFENADPRRGSGHENVLTRLKLDATTDAVLAAQGLDRLSVPLSGQRVRIRDTANLSTGGTAEDCTDEVHAENLFVAEQAAAIVGIDVAGIDFLSPDITRPVSETGGGIVEINAAPGLRMHLAPSTGMPRDVGGPIVDLLFPRPRESRIPIAAITGTNGKSTTARMVARIVRGSGKTVGITSTTGVYINERLIRAADASGPKSARMVLANPTVDVAVLETARGGILREGLGFDRCDVGCVLNVTEDHMGIKGIDTLDDLASVKSVVVEAVKRRGISVLNADDARTRKMRRDARGSICWFSMRASDDLVDAHIQAGGMAVRLETDGTPRIILYRKGERVPVIDPTRIPATFGGAAAFNTENALAATAIAFALGFDVETIANGLAGFTTSYEDSPGRLNVIERHGVTVIVDYAHNPAAVEALGRYLSTLRRPGRRFIGTYSVPGDRRDEDLVGMGRLAATLFDELVFRETPDGRGRPRGEINAMMTQGALAGGLAEDRVHRIVDEGEATLFAMRLAAPGDVVVLSPSQLDMVWQMVCDFVPDFATCGEQIDA